MAKAPLDIRSLARRHTESAIKTLHAIMHMKDAPPSSRVAAAQALLDRGWGKPKESVDINVRKDAAEFNDAELSAIIDASRSGNGVDETEDSAPQSDRLH